MIRIRVYFSFHFYTVFDLKRWYLVLLWSNRTLGAAETRRFGLRSVWVRLFLITFLFSEMLKTIAIYWILWSCYWEISLISGTFIDFHCVLSFRLILWMCGRSWSALEADWTMLYRELGLNKLILYWNLSSLVESFLLWWNKCTVLD